jgi:hypothetical protein
MISVSMNFDTLKRSLPGKTVVIGWVLLIVGVIVSIAAYVVDAKRGAFNNVILLMFLASLAGGGLFLVALEYISGAVWSVPMRRVNEFMAGLVVVLPLAALPLFFNLHHLFHWVHADAVASDPLLQAKEPYLNVRFFVIRFVVTMVVWMVFYWLFTANSKKQDTTKDQKLTRANVKIAAAFMPLFAVSLSFMAIDWMMSIEAHWYSTILGIYYFSGTALAAVAATTYIAIKFMENGLLPNLKRDHLYSLGTLMFVFVNFWAYIAFSQFMLTWYANLPEETFWFMKRWKEGWQFVSVALIIVHFAVPYFVLLAQDAKMDSKRLKFIAIWILFAHLFDLYWLVMPSFKETVTFGWVEVGFPLIAIGAVIVLLSYKVRKNNLVPIGDPKLERALNFRL